MSDKIVFVGVVSHIIEQVCAHTSYTRWATYQADSRHSMLSIKEDDLQLHIITDNPLDLELFLNGARWALSMLHTIKKCTENFKYISLSSQEIDEIKFIPAPYKYHIKNDTNHNDRLFEPTPYDLRAIQALLSACSAAPWQLSIEGLDHFSGSDVLYNDDLDTIEIISTNHIDIVYTMKIKTYLNILIRILQSK